MLNKFCKFMLSILGWKVYLNKERFEKKSVVVVAPHTSYMDGVIGWLGLNSLGLNYCCISAEWLFFFPLKYIMRRFMHAIPCGKKSGNSITVACKALASADDMHVVICPEGHLSATSDWSLGFLFIAKKAKCDIDFVEIDYQNKEIKLRSSMDKDFVEKCSRSEATEILKMSYKDAHARYPKKFVLPN